MNSESEGQVINNLHAVASQYPSRRAFKKGNPIEYYTAEKLGLIDVVCSHMQKKKRSEDYTRQEVFQEAKKHKSKLAFRNYCYGAYRAALRLEIIDELAYKNQKAGPSVDVSAMTLDIAYFAAKKYWSFGAFKAEDEEIYNWAKSRGMLQTICGHMRKINRENQDPDRPTSSGWNIDSVVAVAKKYQFRSDFRAGNISAMRWAFENGVLDEVCAHMQPRRPSNIK